jgi:hypothetical protein
MDEGWLRYFEGNPGLRVLKVEYGKTFLYELHVRYALTLNTHI